MYETVSSTGNRSLVVPLGRQIILEEPRNVIASLALISDLACTILLRARPRFQRRTPFSSAKLLLEVPSPLHPSPHRLACSQGTCWQHARSLGRYILFPMPLFCHSDMGRPHRLLPFAGWELRGLKKKRREAAGQGGRSQR